MDSSRRINVASTLGIDLAAQPANTALCRIQWGHGQARIDRLENGLDDDALTTAFRTAAITAIDAPFGWPVAFAAAVHGWTHFKDWPDASRDELRYRLTNR